jgi:hypothetical protein
VKPRRIVGPLLAWALLGCACDEVTVPEPVGDEIVPLEAEEWVGTWADPEGHVVFIQEVDAEAGHLRLVWFEDDDTLERQQVDAIVRTSNGWWLGTVFVPDDAELSGEYWWGRVERTGDTLLVWVPNPRKFAELVRAGLLPGKVESEDTVRLGKLEPRHLKLVTSEERGVLFEWDEPLILRKISR